MTRPWRSRPRKRARHLPWWRRITRFLLDRDVDEDWVIIVFAAAIGAGAGYAIVGFYATVHLIQAGADWSVSHLGLPLDPRWAAFLLVPVGLGVARWMRFALAGGGSGEMVPTLMVSVARQRGELPVLRTLAKVFCAAVTLGAGGSLGAEGPVALAGGTVGSGLAQLFRFRANRTKVLLGCGAAAGISAAFNAPIAGVMFALEVVLGTFTVTALSPVVVASVVGAVVSRAYLGSHPSFDVPTEFLLVSVRQLGFYLALGLATGLVAVFFVRIFYLALDFAERMPVPWLGPPLVGGLLVAAAGFVHPQLLGPGRPGIQMVLFGQLAGLLALAVALLKGVTAGLTMGGGGAGGVFSPSLFVGASFGSFFGLTIQSLFPGLGIRPEAYALAGMAGVLSGATFAPLTAIIIVFEMTNDYGLILPLMLVCVVSYVLARGLNGDSIYTLALAREGEKIRPGVDRSVLESVSVRECYDRDPDVVTEDAPVRDLLNRLRRSRQTDFPVVNRDLELVGVLSYPELARAVAQEDMGGLLLAADLMLEDMETVSPDETLLEAMRKMGVRDLDFIPVVEGDGSHRLLGMLGRSHLMEAYETHVMFSD
ncbi:MAG: chloride channel protein [Candidatus Palauibacterales bacterium]|nr:chloride channel protein [Candidatus Palauibacterales bacterium]